MLSLNYTAAIQIAAKAHPDPTLRSLLAMRGAQLAPTDGEAVKIIVFEAGDTLDRLEAELGFTPLPSAIDTGVHSPTPTCAYCRMSPSRTSVSWRIRSRIEIQAE